MVDGWPLGNAVERPLIQGQHRLSELPVELGVPPILRILVETLRELHEAIKAGNGIDPLMKEFSELRVKS